MRNERHLVGLIDHEWKFNFWYNAKHKNPRRGDKPTANIIQGEGFGKKRKMGGKKKPKTKSSTKG